MAANTSRHYGSEASMSDVEIASFAAVIKKIEHACKQQPRLSVVHIEFTRKRLLLFYFAERRIYCSTIENLKNIFFIRFIKYLLLGTILY